MAQTDTAALSAQRAALTAFRDHPNATRSSAVAARPLVLDPIVLPMWYDEGIKREPAAAPVIRDSAQSVSLAMALGGAIASSADTPVCTPGGPPRPTDGCKLLDVVIVSVGQPRPVGAEWSLVIRTIAPVRTANGSITLSRYGSVYLVRLARADGNWRVRCLTNVPTDSPANPANIAARCGPP